VIISEVSPFGSPTLQIKTCESSVRLRFWITDQVIDGASNSEPSTGLTEDESMTVRSGATG
jgi:hypothetical protein